MTAGFVQYRRKQIAELRLYVAGEKMSDNISISPTDILGGSPKLGDMIARNPNNHDDQWLVAAQYFADNFEPISPAVEPPREMVAMAERIAKNANECCGRSDGYEEQVRDLALAELAALRSQTLDEAARVADARYAPGVATAIRELKVRGGV